MKFYPIYAQACHATTHSVYVRHKDEIDENLIVSDERASFIIKTIMSGLAPRIYTYKDKIVKGNELLTVLKRCFDGSLVFTGKLYEEINGKTYNEIPFAYHSCLEEKYVEVIDIALDSKPEDVEYFLATIENN